MQQYMLPKTSKDLKLDTVQVEWLTSKVDQLSELLTNLNQVHIFTGAYLPRFNCMTKETTPSSYAIFSKTGFSNISLHLQQPVQVYIRDETDHC